MSIFDGILKSLGGAPDDVANLATKLGIDTAVVEKAIAALAHAHQMQGDTVESAAAHTGLPAGTLQQIVEHIGGEGSLMEFANILDRDRDGNPFDDIAEAASSFFGKK